jgi:DMSO/TMAO reductase YedYZ molybdopterin-dependent catalytic subunit
MRRKTGLWLSGVLVWIAVAISAAAQAPTTAAEAATLMVKGAVKQELRLTQAELKAMPRTKVTAKGHDGATHEYAGVALGALLVKAGVPQGGDLRGKSMTLCIVAEARDGYRAVFSLAELDADFANEAVIVADTSDGNELGPEQGPLRLVVPGDKRQGRWVRLLKALSVVNAGA